MMKVRSRIPSITNERETPEGSADGFSGRELYPHPTPPPPDVRRHSQPPRVRAVKPIAPSEPSSFHTRTLSEAGTATPEPPKETGHATESNLIEKALSLLGPLTADCCLLLSQPELSTPTLRGLGFANGCKTTAHYSQEFFTVKNCSPTSCCIIIVTVGKNVEAAARTVEALDKNPNAPCLVNIVIRDKMDNKEEEVEAWSSGEKGPTVNNPGLVLVKEFCEVRERLFSAGSDDVIGLCPGEALPPQRLVEAVERTEFMWKRAADTVRMETSNLKQLAERKLQVAFRKFLSDLPGRECENIPREDPKLNEHGADSGSQTGVGGYQFEKKLGSGSFGSVFKSIAPDNTVVAVKVIQKSTMKHAKAYFSTDREACLMLHLQEHPNVVKAHTVLHGKRNIYVVMKFAGHCNLHSWIMRKLQSIGGSVLPEGIMRKFIGQEVSAVSHLHKAKCCHRDLKPTNWIISDDGSKLCLADFGLAMQVVHKNQMVRETCGSFPFVAPEVFRAPREGRGYDPCCADVWSLAVNFIELTRGPYSIEKMLKWVPTTPAETSKKLADLATLPEQWAGLEYEVHEDLFALITDMLVLNADKRCDMVHVRKKLEQKDCLSVSDVDSHEEKHTLQRCRTWPHCLKSQAVRTRFVDSQAKPEKEEADMTKPLGGAHVVKAAIGRMLNTFIATPGFGEVYDIHPERIASARDLYMDEMMAIFDRTVDKATLEAIKNEFQTIHSGIIFTRAHAGVMADALLDAFTFAGISNESAKAIAERFHIFILECLQPNFDQAKRARERNTPEWRGKVLMEVETELVHSFAEQLKHLLVTRFSGKSKALQEYPQSKIASAVLQYLKGDGRACPLPKRCIQQMSKAQALSLINLCQDAFAVSRWRAEVAQTFYFAMLEEWQNSIELGS